MSAAFTPIMIAGTSSSENAGAITPH